MASKKKSVPPKLNKFMHPRNPYRTPPSFKKLATKYPEFREYCTYDVSGKVYLDFKNPKAVRALTACLLDQDFGLKVSIPDDRLVPTLPLRLNYLLWIEDLLTHAAHYDSEHIVVGADIGVGAACIYPLLGAKHFGWCMLGTETDQVSYTSAYANVHNNKLQDVIFVKKVENDNILKNVVDEKGIQTQLLKWKLRRKKIGDAEFSECDTSDILASTQNSQNEVRFDSSQSIPAPESDGLKDETKKNEQLSTFSYDFTMCNPPFFSSEEELDTMKKSRKGRGEPVSAATGAIHEKVIAGGEVSFITQMIEESQLLKDKIRIFTSLIGSKAHIKPVKDSLKAAKAPCCVLSEFCQGRTMRWGIAWTFDPSLHLDQVKSKKDMVTNKPFVLMMPRSLMTVYSVVAAWNMIKKWLHQLKVKVRVLKNSKYFVSANVKAFKPTWLHQRRKKREDKKRGASTSKDNMKIEDDSEDTEVMDPDMELPKRKWENSEDTSQYIKHAEEEQKNKKPKMCGGSEHNVNANSSSEAVPEQQTSTKCPLTGLSLDNPNCEYEKGITSSTGEQIDEQKNLSKGKMERLECILRCNLQVKQVGALISLEAYYLDGSSGKDGLNQLLQFMRNQLTRPNS